jgi:aldose sugar dehydrogenase
MRKLATTMALSLALAACGGEDEGGGGPSIDVPGETSCTEVSSGAGPAGTTALRYEAVVTGLEVPWGVAILPGGTDWLVTERPGRVRIVRSGNLAASPVLTVPVAEGGEGGLLGIAADPAFASNSRFFIYYTTSKGGTNVNRVERFTLSADRASATPAGVILDDIPAGTFHNGGRIRFGPDGQLYVGTGDARAPERSRDESSLNGKILRVTVDGAASPGNPVAGNRWFIKGVRNVEGFDWLDERTLVVSDHGPSGELGRSGGDEVSIARAGDDLGWPDAWRCQEAAGTVTPILTWVQAVPPGGLAIHRGSSIPGWNGSIVMGTLGSQHLHQIVLGPQGVASHGTYFGAAMPEGLGRVREVFDGPGGELYVTTSNCDSRGSCPAGRDGIYRILPR